MSSTIIQIGKADVRFGAAPTTGPVIPANLTDYSCQVTSAAINSSSNATTTAIPATFCSPASEANVPVASSFTLDLDFLQDWTIAAGLSAWLFVNDATEQAFALYLKNAVQPVAQGKIICQAGAFGGAPGETLTATVSLAIQGYPVIMNPAGVSLRPADVVDPLDVTWETFGDAGPPATLVALKANTSYGDGKYTGPAFTTGQFVLLKDASKANYKAGVWAVGAYT